MDDISQIREKFSHDAYATQLTGITIDEAQPGYAKCSLKVNSGHLNAAGFVMGGAIFTLADFAFAVASNSGNVHTVSLSSQISYVSASKGPLLIAEARCVKEGKHVCFFSITVSDADEAIVATVSATGFRKQ